MNNSPIASMIADDLDVDADHRDNIIMRANLIINAITDHRDELTDELIIDAIMTPMIKGLADHLTINALTPHLTTDEIRDAITAMIGDAIID